MQAQSQSVHADPQIFTDGWDPQQWQQQQQQPSLNAPQPPQPPDLVTVFKSPLTSPHASVPPQTAAPSARFDNAAVPYYAGTASDAVSSSRVTSPLAGSDYVPSNASRECSLSDIVAAAAAADDDDDVVVDDDDVEVMVVVVVAWAA